MAHRRKRRSPKDHRAHPLGAEPSRTNRTEAPPPDVPLWRTLAHEARGLLPIIATVTMVALAVRLFRLGASELWLDEILVLWDAGAGTNEHISRAHRLHLSVVGFFLGHFGESPVALRLWGALAGSLAAPAVALAGGWLAGKRLAALWGGLVALSPFLVFYSQDANYYGAMACFAAIQIAGVVLLFRGAAVTGIATVAVAGFASYINHPFSLGLTVPALVVCAVGLLAVPSLRREVWALSPSQWRQRPALPVFAAGTVFAVPLMLRVGRDAATMLSQRLGAGEPPPGVRMELAFFHEAFTAWGVSYFGRETTLAGGLAWIPLALFAVGTVTLLWAGRRYRPAPALALLGIAVPVLCFAAVFHLDHHGFYPRYLTCFVPLYLGVAAWGCIRVGEKLATKITPPHVVWLPAGVLLACQLPFLAWYHGVPRGNFAELAQELRAQWTPGETILVPHRNDWVQLAYYFQADAGRPAWPEDFTVRHADERFEHSMPHLFRARLLREDTAWVVSGWRASGSQSAFDFLIEAVPQAAQFRSPHGHAQDAQLLRWQPTEEERADLLPPATRRIGPFEQARWPDDGRHREVIHEGTPLFERAFDGPVAHLVTIPENAPASRQVVLRVMRPEIDPLLLVVSVEGSFAGIWEVQPGSGEARVVTDVHLAAAAHEVKIHGLTPRLGYSPENVWQWAGLELLDEPEAPSPRWDQATERFMAFSAVPWDMNPDATPREWALELAPAYPLAVSHEDPPPGGDQAVLDFLIKDATPGSETAYHALFTTAIPIGPEEIGRHLAFSTYLKLDGTESHAASLAVAFLDRDGNLLRREIGKQHLLAAPWADGWHRFVEVCPVPATIGGTPVAFVAPGVMVFPPDPTRAEARGRVRVGRIEMLAPSDEEPVLTETGSE